MNTIRLRQKRRACEQRAKSVRRKPVNPPEHAYHVLEIMVKSMESGRTGQAMPIVSSFTPPRFDQGDARTAPHLDHAPE